MLADEAEMVNLASKLPDVVRQLDAKLRQVIDCAAVSADVADYNQKSFIGWMNQAQVAGGRWKDPFTQNTTASMQAIKTWLVRPLRSPAQHARTHAPRPPGPSTPDREARGQGLQTHAGLSPKPHAEEL